MVEATMTHSIIATFPLHSITEKERKEELLRGVLYESLNLSSFSAIKQIIILLFNFSAIFCYICYKILKLIFYFLKHM